MPITAGGEKPAYLGLLNAIALAEANAGVYLTAWAGATPDKDLAATLRLVAARETSHGELFARRLCELGFEVRQKPDPAAERRLAKLGDREIGDVEKIGASREREGDPFAEIKARMARGEFDPMTASLLTWYIGEEVDSARRLDEAYACVRARANGHGAPADTPGADAQAIMACMTAGFSRLEKSIEKLAKAVK